MVVKYILSFENYENPPEKMIQESETFPNLEFWSGFCRCWFLGRVLSSKQSNRFSQ